MDNLHTANAESIKYQPRSLMHQIARYVSGKRLPVASTEVCQKTKIQLLVKSKSDRCTKLVQQVA